MAISRRALLQDILRAIAFGATVLTGALGVRSALGRDRRGAASPAPQLPQYHTLRLMDPSGRALTVSSRCPHLGCRVHRDDDGKGLTCPCHGSRFDAHGRRVSGPAKQDLTRISG